MSCGWWLEQEQEQEQEEEHAAEEKAREMETEGGEQKEPPGKSKIKCLAADLPTSPCSLKSLKTWTPTIKWFSFIEKVMVY